MKSFPLFNGLSAISGRPINPFIHSFLTFALLFSFSQFSQASNDSQMATMSVPVIQKADTVINNPPNIFMWRDGVKSIGLIPFVTPKSDPTPNDDLVPDAAEVLFNLNIKETPGEIFNPSTGEFDKVLLRAYRGGNDDPNAPFVAPTIMIVPGDTVRVNLNNQLNDNDPSCKHIDDVNKPHCFNSTNLHSHGLWISPAGNSDNVLIKIDPKVNFTYEWNIPVDHPAGTFWYHPHLHGSTALQVSSGMAGALIIKGDRTPSKKKNGDIDTLLRQANGAVFPERVVLLQQIQYACRTPDGKIKKSLDGQWLCEPGDVGTIEGYDQFGPDKWPDSGRYTTINGRVMPRIESQVGQIERWRLINAGVHETIKLSFRKAIGGSADMLSASFFAAASLAEKSEFIDANCSGPQATQLSLAMDGLTRSRIVEQKQGTLQPGYREDLLMVFPENGIYCIIDEAASKGTVNGNDNPQKILGFVKVIGEQKNIDNVAYYVGQRLIASARLFMPVDVRKSIIKNLRKKLGLARFVDHQSIAANEVTGHQTLAFNIAAGEGIDTRFEVGNLDDKGQPDDLSPYDPDRVDRDLVLGGVDEWTLKSFFNSADSTGGHPFHIHVNPFQIISIKDKDGKEVSGYEPGNTSQYARLQGVWKDTLFIDAENYTIVTRTRYQRYIGEYVLHCHILDHEDQGMMQNVSISLPDSKGLPTRAHSMLH